MGFWTPVPWRRAFSDPWSGSGSSKSRTEPRSPTEEVDRRLYRKTPLFDRFVQFNVQIEGSGIRH